MILDGKKLRDKILENISVRLANSEIKPTLAVILVGDDPASRIYVNNKKKTAEKIGIDSIVFEYTADVSEKEIIEKINSLNNDDSITAILVQLPLPEHISKDKIIDSIDPKKDVDGLTKYNTGMLFSGGKPYVYPCTPKGILAILDEYGIQIEGKRAVVVGRSNLVGRPVAQMLLDRNATVTMCHSKTVNLGEITRTADILVSAVGKKIITADMVKDGAVVIDVGISKNVEGKLTGDVDFENILKIASYITPVPGGVGPMTIASLMSNTVELMK